MTETEEILIFQMGKFSAKVPIALQYTKNHLWVSLGEVSRVGITTYEQRYLMDIMNVDVLVQEGSKFQKGDFLMYIEGMKAIAEMYAEFSGVLKKQNGLLSCNPTLINASPYEDGWILELENVRGDLLSPEEYVELLRKDWEETKEEIVKESQKRYGKSV